MSRLARLDAHLAPLMGARQSAPQKPAHDVGTERYVYAGRTFYGADCTCRERFPARATLAEAITDVERHQATASWEARHDA